MNFRSVDAAGVIALTGAVAAMAHGGATGIVKERMDAMGAMGKVVKSLSAMMRGATSGVGMSAMMGADNAVAGMMGWAEPG